MKHSYRWYYWGIITFSFCLGIIIALSKSPVAGAAITAVLGLGGALVAVMTAKKEAKKDPEKALEINYLIVGKTLVCFSVSLLVGIASVITMRILVMPASAVRSFVWDDKHKPVSVYEALDWIKVTDVLEKAGYSHDQVKVIYQLRDTSKSHIGGSVYGMPYWQTIEGVQQVPSGLASPLNIANQGDPFGILNQLQAPVSRQQKDPG